MSLVNGTYKSAFCFEWKVYDLWSLILERFLFPSSGLSNLFNNIYSSRSRYCLQKGDKFAQNQLNSNQEFCWLGSLGSLEGTLDSDKTGSTWTFLSFPTLSSECWLDSFLQNICFISWSKTEGRETFRLDLLTLELCVWRCILVQEITETGFKHIFSGARFYSVVITRNCKDLFSENPARAWLIRWQWTKLWPEKTQRILMGSPRFRTFCQELSQKVITAGKLWSFKRREKL